MLTGLVVAAPAQAADVVVTGVVTVDGVPLPDAATKVADRRVRVGYWEPSTDTWVSAVTDASTGEFELTVPATASHYLFANVSNPGTSYPDRSTKAFTPVFAGAGGAQAYAWQAVPAAPALTAATDVVLDLDRTGTLVVEGGDKGALEGLELVTAGGQVVTRWAQGGAPSTATGLVPGRYRVASDPSWAAGHHPAAPWTSDELVVRAGETTRVTPHLTTVSGGLVGVVRYRGVPVEGARVVVQGVQGGWTDFGDWRRTAVRTDSQGRYRVPPGAVLPGRYRVEVRKGGLGDYGGVVATIAAGAPTVQDVGLTRYGTVRGTIPPLLTKYGFEAMLVADDRRVVAATPVPGSTGAFSFSAPAGRYAVVVHSGDREQYARRDVRIGVGSATDLGVLRPTTSTAAVGGYVTGGPADNTVRYSTDVDPVGEHGIVWSSGRYLVRDLVPGVQYRVSVGLPGPELVTSSTVASGSTRRDIALPSSSGSLRGRLVVQGVPLTGGDVTTRWTYTYVVDHVTSDGRWKAPATRIDPRDTKLRLEVAASGMLPGVPYEYRFPPDVRTVTRPPTGVRQDLGTIEVQVAR